MVCSVFIFCRVLTSRKIWRSGFRNVFVITRNSLYGGCYIQVHFHTFYCNFGWAEEYRSLYRDFVKLRFVKSSFHCNGLSIMMDFFKSHCLQKFPHHFLTKLFEKVFKSWKSFHLFPSLDTINFLKFPTTTKFLKGFLDIQ